MPRGYRSIFVAVVGWLVLAADAPHRESIDVGQPEAAQSTQQASPKAAAAANTAQPRSRTENYRPCEQPYSERNSELCAQWRAAEAAHEAVRWAWWQFVVSMFGLGGLIYTLHLNTKATRAATDSVEAQVASERPILQIVKLKVRPVVREGVDHFRLALDWLLVNQGKTGCWMEAMCIYIHANAEEEPLPSACEERFTTKLVAHVMPGKGWGIQMDDAKLAKEEDDGEWTFSEEEETIIKATKRIFVFGYSIYRDPGGRRWRTGFALYMRLCPEMKSETFSPCPNEDLWADIRLPNAADESWLERVALKLHRFWRALYRGERY